MREEKKTLSYTSSPPSWRPYPFQCDGAQWLEENPRSILADEMGLGKTIQIGLLLDDMYTYNHLMPLDVLILCKSVLSYHWQDELLDKFGIRATIAVGTDDSDVKAIIDGGIVITNHAKLRLPRFQRAAISRRWDAVIIDEAHRVKGRKSQQADFLFKLAKMTERIHFVSGSPMPNGSPEELWTWLHAIDSQEFKSYWNWVRETCVTEATDWGIKIKGAADPEQLRQRLTDYFLRRNVEDVDSQLPDRLPTTMIRHPLSRRQWTMYTQMRKEFIVSSETFPKEVTVEAPNTAARWAKLRQICLSPVLFDGETDVGGKVPATLEIAEELIASGIPFVVFTWHRAFAALLGEALWKHTGLRGGLILGGMSPAEQFAEATQFTTGEYPYLVGTIAAMGEGLNLQSAGAVIFAEISYVPEDNMQAIKRVHRHGQTRRVRTYALISRGTLEEYIYDIVMEKRQDFVVAINALKAVMA